MQAVVFERYGGPEVLKVREVPRPQPKPDEMLIRVRATEVTKSECEMRSMHYPVAWFQPMLRLALGWRRPRRQILGMYFAGEIAEVGSEVRDLRPGDAVFGTTSFQMGTYAEYVCVNARASVLPKPQGLSFADAAASLLGGFNALHFMNLASVERGMSVLINGAGGSIGSHAIQIAKARGAKVTAVDFARKESGIRNFGADRFIDCESGDLDAVDEAFDVVFDMVPLPTGKRGEYAKRLDWLKPGGCYMTGNPRLSQMLKAPLTTRFTNKTVRFAFAGESRDDLRALRELLASGQVRSVVDASVEMADIVHAHRRVESEQRVGAIVMTP